VIRDGTFSSGRAVSEQVEGFVAVVVEDGNQGVSVHCSGGEKKYDFGSIWMHTKNARAISRGRVGVVSCLNIPPSFNQ
jgi:hypothetical protein